MQAARRFLILLTLLLAAGRALSDAGRPAPLSNEQLLEQARKEPDHYARLRRDLRAFLLLSPEEQARRRRLDQQLRDLDSPTQARLRRTLERYADWLDRLSEADRQSVESAPDMTERLRRIKAIRQRQWEARLPKADRDRLAIVPSGQREALLRQLRADERQYRQEWRIAVRHWDELLRGAPPTHLKELPPAVQSFVNDNLRHRLSKADQQRLTDAEGKWPQFMQTLVELADKNPLLLPGPPTGPTRLKDLPEDVQQRLASLTPSKRIPLMAAEGKWPQYAVAVTELARRNKVRLPRQLGPATADELPAPVRYFIHNDLEPILDADERTKLHNAERHWPRYPRVILELARKHRLVVPGMTLPGLREDWERYRTHDAAARESLSK